MRQFTATKQQKLALLLRDSELAGALVKAGFDTPRKIKAASDEQLEAVKGIGPATRKALRQRFRGRQD